MALAARSLSSKPGRCSAGRSWRGAQVPSHGPSRCCKFRGKRDRAYVQGGLSALHCGPATFRCCMTHPRRRQPSTPRCCSTATTGPSTSSSRASLGRGS